MPALCSIRLQWLNSMHFLLRRVDYDLISSYTWPSFYLALFVLFFVLSADSTIALLLAELNQEWIISISSSIFCNVNKGMTKNISIPNVLLIRPFVYPAKGWGRRQGVRPGQPLISHPAPHQSPAKLQAPVCQYLIDKNHFRTNYFAIREITKVTTEGSNGYNSRHICV